GKGYSIFNKMVNSPIHASKKLLNQVAGMLSGDKSSNYSLLEDQIAAKNAIYDKIRQIKHNFDGKHKSIVLVHGGPGTGKTVIALNILAELAGLGRNVRYATKSSSLIGGIKYQLPNGHAAKKVISSLTEFNFKKCPENNIDVLLVDEAHRIEEYYSTGFGRAKRNLTEMPMIDALLRAAKVLVIFIDDKQAIRSAEVGSTQMIRECAIRNNATLDEITLVSQFRCNGSDNYLDWIDQVLYHKPITSHFKSNDYDFRVFDSPIEMSEAIISRNDGDTTSRIMAGFCWPWTKELDANGEPPKDVVIGEFAMPWETHRDLQTPPQGYVKFTEWAYRPEGIKQVGCIYTAQGFEFDYAGVIIGPDIRYDSAHDCLVTDQSATHDPTLKRDKGKLNFDTYARNIYRVLLSRGMKGTYVYCCDPHVGEYLKRKMLG
ncbi:MAG: DUF2075 domain-containing protein, partial [Bacteroidaceae bacterium]|nr:DUF2075 domain-containing protein [Bacteroidaceae bacterium]